MYCTWIWGRNYAKRARETWLSLVSHSKCIQSHGLYVSAYFLSLSSSLPILAKKQQRNNKDRGQLHKNKS